MEDVEIGVCITLVSVYEVHFAIIVYYFINIGKILPNKIRQCL